MQIIDFSNVILGRAASKTAKLLLEGENLAIINAEKAVVRGTQSGILEKFVRRYGWKAKGNPLRHGPKISRMPDKLAYSAIQHMLPYKKARGKDALKRLSVFIGVPKKLEKSKIEKWEDVQNTAKKNVLSIQEISEKLGLQRKVQC